MKNVFHLLVLSFLFFGCEKNNEILEYDKIDLQPFIVENYYEDAKQLYFHEIINNKSHFNYNNPVLDKNEIEKILKIIQAVYNADSPARDSVFNKYGIHARYCYSFNSISLKVKPNEPEISRLAKGEIPTGEEYLDEILKKYSLDSVRTAFSYPDFEWLTIFTSEEYNMIPIQKELADLESVLIAEFSHGCIGGGNTISLTRNKSSAIITFSIGYGDCPAGCIYRKYWEFKVVNETAKFIGTYEK